MKLECLLQDIDYTLLSGNLDVLIKDIAYDSRCVCGDYVYIAIVGNKVDGHDYITEAIQNGAKVIIVSKVFDVLEDVSVVMVDNTNKILSKLSMNLFGNPQKDLTTIGITGTKGKTTVSFMIKDIIEKSGKCCGVIGTMGVYILDKYYEIKNTTPLAYDILKYMREMVDDGVDYMVMEVSSQALKYDRVNDIIFDYGIFTNLTKDHIGEFEHSDIDDYVYSKSKLFQQCINGILNIDDNYYSDIVRDATANISTYGYGNDAMLRLVNLELCQEDNMGIIMDVDGIIKDSFKVNIPGKFSSYNAMCAIMTCYLLGIDVRHMRTVLEKFMVKGRVERVDVGNKLKLFIDYAHNGVSTESILMTMREYHPKRLVTIFGCGGNRSRDRRYEMGEAAGKYSDLCIITEDNNRDEDFDDIASDIMLGLRKNDCRYIVIPDRKAAIKYAIMNGMVGDVIMLLGKGHENYKEIKGVRYSFDERIVIKEIMNEIKESNQKCFDNYY